MIFRSCEHALGLPRKRRALPDWKMAVDRRMFVVALSGPLPVM
jgi:hypothetical protein